STGFKVTLRIPPQHGAAISSARYFQIPIFVIIGSLYLSWLLSVTVVAYAPPLAESVSCSEMMVGGEVAGKLRTRSAASAVFAGISPTTTGRVETTLTGPGPDFIVTVAALMETAAAVPTPELATLILQTRWLAAGPLVFDWTAAESAGTEAMKLATTFMGALSVTCKGLVEPAGAPLNCRKTKP